MKKKVLIAIIIAIGILAGCGNDDSVPSNTNGIEDLGHDMGSLATDAPEESTEPEGSVVVTDDGLIKGGENHPIGNRAVVDGKMQSYLTGEWKDAEVAQRRAMAVMIPNNYLKIPGTSNYSTVPQHGISQASIIYEAPVEGRITRLMAFFEDYDDLDLIGPVRSSRRYYVYEAMAADAIYCNWGLAVPYVSDLINSDKVDNVSVKLEGIDVGADEAFGRGLNSGYAKEFTSSLNIEGYNKAVKRLGYATTYEESKHFKQVFTFTDEGYLATYSDYPDATVVYPGGPKSNKGGYGSYSDDKATRFEYNEDDRLYYRYQYGEPHVDADNDEQLAVTNIIFKVCHGEVIPESKDYLIFGVHGTGTAYIFTNGKVIEGTWSRSGDNEPNIFYDKSGNEIVLNQGKTWFCLIWEEYAEYMSWE